MRNSTIKLTIFNTLIILVFFLNSFIWSILNYQNVIIVLAILIILFNILFGFEKDGHRYIPDTIVNIIIFLLSFFLIYYLLGIYTGFVRTTMHWSKNGLITLIIPYIIYTILKEFLRYQVLEKSSKSKKLIAYCCVLFTIMEISINFSIGSIENKYDIFLLFATKILPAISTNIASCYIASKVGYKPNIVWLLILNLYSSLLPIIPDIGVYLSSI